MKKYKHSVATVMLFLLMIYTINTIAQNKALSIGGRNVGLGFGNSKNYTGIRFNLWDKNVAKINGIAISGVSKTKITQGLNLGIIITDSIATGVTISPIVANAQKLSGLHIGGLASGGDVANGVTVGGILFANKKLKGIGMGVITIADSLQGIVISLGGTFSHDDRGEGNAVGVIASVYVNSLYSTNGLCIGMFNQIQQQKGFTIGVINKTKNLRGVQLGLWNVALNKKFLKRTPFININLKKKDLYNT